MKETYSENEIYPKSFLEKHTPPRKGEKGDPRTGCNWCGSIDLSISYSGRYCSFACYAAGSGKRPIGGIIMSSIYLSLLIVVVVQRGIYSLLEGIALIVYAGFGLYHGVKAALALYIGWGVDDEQIYEY